MIMVFRMSTHAIHLGGQFGNANKSALNTAWRPYEVRQLFSRSIYTEKKMAHPLLLRNFHSQTQTWPCYFHQPFLVYLLSYYYTVVSYYY